MADEQQAPIGTHSRHRIERLRGIEVAGQRWVHCQSLALLGRPVLGRELGRLACAHLGAEQHCVEIALQPRDRDARSARLHMPALRQAASGIRARAMRLSLRVTK